MKIGKIVNRVVGTISSISGISFIILATFNLSLNPSYLGYVGGVILIVFGGYLWLWDLSHTPKIKKK